MSRTLRSLYYPAFYLTAAGLALVLAPDFALKLFFSTGHYGDVMPRMAGATTLALGILVVQIIRQRVEGLYATLVGARVMLCAVWMSLFFYTRDPFFLIVFGMVAVGMVWTAVGLVLDSKDGLAVTPAPYPGGRPRFEGGGAISTIPAVVT